MLSIDLMMISLLIASLALSDKFIKCFLNFFSVTEAKAVIPGPSDIYVKMVSKCIGCPIFICTSFRKKTEIIN